MLGWGILLTVVSAQQELIQCILFRSYLLSDWRKPLQYLAHIRPSECSESGTALRTEELLLAQ